MSDQESNMTEIPAGEVEVADSTHSSPGARLAAAREANGWSIEQVASQLNLAPRQIQAIENDNFVALPVASIARGFVRSYAKLLKVDPAPLIAAIPDESKNVTVGIMPAATLSSPLGDTRLPSMADRPAISPKWYVALVVLAVVLAGLLWAQQAGVWHEVVESLSSWIHHQMNSAPGDSAKASPPDVVPSAVAEAKSAGEEGHTAEARQASGMADNAPTSAEASATEANVASPVAATTEMSPAAATSVAPTAAENSKAEALVLKVTADSWVELRGADNKIIFSRVIPAGNTETIDVNGPASLVIGNSAGIEATYHGVPLDLKANTTSNVARLNLNK